MNETTTPDHYLVFTLYSPLGACGSIALGEERPSWTRPGRAAVLGLAAAALGIERSDEHAHAKLDRDLHYAVRVDAAGRPLSDYHTAQVASRSRNRTFATRREELEPESQNTILSNREYRSDCLFTAALWSRENAGDPTLPALVHEAMRTPGFTLYLGRKASPLGLPLNPQMIRADGIIEALNAYERAEPAEHVLDAIGRSALPLIATDADAAGIPADARLETRCDRLASRSRWQFHERTEALFTETT